MRFAVGSAVVLIIAFALNGCGKPPHQLVPLNGKVTYKGQPLRFGCVTLQPERGQWSRGNIQSDGTFAMVTPGEGDGAAVGMNKVRISCFEAQDPAKNKGGNSMGMLLGKSFIPRKYTAYETSGLTVEVKADNNDPFVIDLKD